MYRRSGSQTYAQVGLESGAMSASPHQLIVMLFDGAHSALVRARLFMQQGDIANKGASISRAINLIENGLKAGLNHEPGDELAANLAALYDYMTRRLLHANLHNDPQAVAEVTVLLGNIADAWRQIGPDYHSSRDSA